MISDEQVIGKILQVPCRNDFQDDPDYWAVPVKDSGVFSTLSYIPKNSDYPTAPTFDSFEVFRVRDKLSGYTWWIYGTNDDFVNACSTCCGAGAIPMPGTLPGPTPVLRIAPCDTLCVQDTNGNYVSRWGLPTLTSGKVYFPYGSLNNVALTAASSSGYANTTLLLSFLNTNWTPFVWTVSADHLTLIATGGSLNDQLCVSVLPITPSP